MSQADPSTSLESLRRVFASHPRTWRSFDYVYPVISRRSRGLSIGVNLNPDKVCNFDCIYCCVDRAEAPARRDVDLTQLEAELDRMLQLAVDGELWQQPEFADVDAAYRRINDIAFSGDGEPTAFPRFGEACEIAIRLKQRHDLDAAKLIVITNATLLDRPAVEAALQRLDEHGGEVWAKLDAGTEHYYQQVDRSPIQLDRILSNILACGRRRPLVIQSLFMLVNGEAPPTAEIDAFVQRLRELVEGGCRVSRVQIYTVARWTTEDYVKPLHRAQLDDIAERLRESLPQLEVEVFYGVTD